MKKILKNEELKSYLKQLLPADYEKFLTAAAEPTAIRINMLKTSKKQFIKFLKTHQVNFTQIDFNQDGLILDKDELPLSHSLAFFTGKFQYQGISSQLPAILLDPRPGQHILDIAAAPGSKSAQISALMQNKGTLILNDNSHTRLQALNTNIQRSGVSNSITLNMRGERIGRLLPEYFDKVLVDAPCTALGTLPANPEVAGWWSRDKLSKLTGIQYYLLVSAIKAVRPGGIIVYSTCSVSPEENELLINRIVKKYPVRILKPEQNLVARFDAGITDLPGSTVMSDLAGAVRIWPHKHAMEGFFAVILQKTDSLGLWETQEKTEVKYLYNHDHPEVQPILAELSELWGIPQFVWTDYNYYLTKERIWMVNGDITEIPVTPYVSAGLLLAEQRLTGWRLVNGSVQVLSSYITKRKIHLTESRLKHIFKTGESDTNLDYGYYILEVNEDTVATVYVENGIMRIRIPHRFNLIL